MPKFKVLIQDENGRDIEDVGDGTFASEEEAAEYVMRELTAMADIAEVQTMVHNLDGDKAQDTITREQAAVVVTLAITDLVRALREFVDGLDLSATDKAMVLTEGREFVTEIGKDLDRIARLLVGAEQGDATPTRSKLN